MTPSEVDRELLRAERDAQSPAVSPLSEDHHAQPAYQRRPSAEIERVISASSVSTSSSEGSTARRQRIPGTRSSSIAGPGGMAMSRVSTMPDLERHPTELERIQTAKSQHSATVGRRLTSKKSTKPMPAFGAGKPFPPPLPDQEEYVVEFDGPEDPMHAQNWPMKKKLLTAAMLGYTTFLSAFASSIFSSATRAVSSEFGVGTTVGLLGVSFYVLGFAFGPILWAPLSELKGRRLPICISMFGFTLFSIATGTAKDLQTILICRFFSGFFGACPLAVVAAVFSDMFDNRTRGLAVTVFSICVFSGPLLGPSVGGFITTSYLGWRWTQYLVTILGAVAFTLDFIFLSETYPPQILVAKASELRRRTNNWGIHAKQEEIEVDFRELVSKNFSRPLRILFTEPIILLLSIYMAFVYGILYLFLTAYPLVFSGVHGMTAGVGGLTFFGMIIGQVMAGITVLLQQPWYQRKLAANNGIPIPEWRLPSVMAGGVAFCAGIFWFGWSGYRPDIHWAVPAASGLLTGFGLMSIFLQALNYIVDAYLMFAASAIAANTLLRSLCGAGFPLFALYMFDGMGIQWASTLLGCVAAALIPIPIVFYIYGRKLRGRSKFAPTMPMKPAAAPAVSDDDEAAVTGSAAVNGEKRETAEGSSRGAAASSVPRRDVDKASEAV